MCYYKCHFSGSSFEKEACHFVFSKGKCVGIIFNNVIKRSTIELVDRILTCIPTGRALGTFVWM
jgi:hypothetical protein